MKDFISQGRLLAFFFNNSDSESITFTFNLERGMFIEIFKILNHKLWLTLGPFNDLNILPAVFCFVILFANVAPTTISILFLLTHEIQLRA